MGANATLAIWATTYTYYNALNQAVMVVTPTGSYTSPQGYVTTTAYNAFGQVTTSTQYAQAISTSSITTATQPSLPGTATVASGANRVTTYIVQALSQILRFRYAVGTRPRSTEELVRRFEQLMQPEAPEGWENIGLSSSSATNVLQLSRWIY
jgi:hypothetical protein